MSLEIEQTEIPDFKDFKWGDEWRALVISKEQRMDKDYYFARIVRYYGKEHDTFEYDIGNSSKEYAWIGRKRKFVGETKYDTDHNSKKFGQRYSFPAETEVITIIDSQGNDKKKTVLKKGRVIYEFTLPVNEENTKHIKTLIGPLTVNKSTTFQVVAGNEPPVGILKDIFFENTVQQIMAIHLRQLSNNLTEKDKKPNVK